MTLSDLERLDTKGPILGQISVRFDTAIKFGTLAHACGGGACSSGQPRPHGRASVLPHFGDPYVLP